MDAFDFFVQMGLMGQPLFCLLISHFTALHLIIISKPFLSICKLVNPYISTYM